VQGRINAFASLPDWQERRQRAHAVRAQVIAHLDEYLEQFTTKLTENGIIVHRAERRSRSKPDCVGYCRKLIQTLNIQANQNSTHQRRSAQIIVPLGCQIKIDGDRRDRA
jgi:L-lactate utilization protein LutB